MEIRWNVVIILQGLIQTIFFYMNENFIKLLIKGKIKLRNCFLKSQNFLGDVNE